MNKTELTSAVAEKVGLSLQDARATVDAIFSTGKRGIIATELAAGHKVQVTGFGSFETRKRKARQGEIPRLASRSSLRPAAIRPSTPAAHSRKGCAPRSRSKAFPLPRGQRGGDSPLPPLCFGPASSPLPRPFRPARAFRRPPPAPVYI